MTIALAICGAIVVGVLVVAPLAIVGAVAVHRITHTQKGTE